MNKNLVAIARALESLRESLAQKPDPFVRDSVIKRFEYTFELSWKLMARVAQANNPEFRGGVKQTLRTAATLGLIDDLERWIEYANARNLSVHTYHEEIAVAIEALVRASFCDDAETLMQSAQGHLAESS